MSSSTVARSRSWGLPLLAKELIAAAARRRTYEVRVAYAAVLLLIGFIVLVNVAPHGGALRVATLGSGKPVLAALSMLQVFGLYLVLPVFAASAIAVEKERQTFDLLLITRLGAWTIILEKFLGQLVPAISFILLSVPLLAFSYSLGGINPDDIWLRLTGLFLLSVRLSAIGIMCSAAFRTTGRALMAAYGFTILACYVEQTAQYQLIPFVNSMLPRGATPIARPDTLRLLFEAPGLISLLGEGLLLSLEGDVSLVLRLSVSLVPSLLFSLLFLAVARWFAVPSTRVRINLFGRLAIPLPRWAGRVRAERDVPTGLPIAWREMPRGNLQVWWWKNASMAVALPLTILVTMLIATTWDRPYDRYVQSVMHLVLSVVYFSIWLIVTLRIASNTAVLFPQERSRETLDILCCTPMDGVSIVDQKMQHIWRLVWLSRLTLMTCVVLRQLFAPSPGHLILSAFLIWRLPELIAWQAMRGSLMVRSGSAAILRSFLSIAAWCFFPLLAVGLLGVVGGGNALPILGIFAGLSPLTLLALTESFPLGYFDDEFVGFLILTILSSVITIFVRIAILRESVNLAADANLRGIYDSTLIERLNARQGRGVGVGSTRPS